MKLGKTLYVTNRKQWRSWLAKNHNKEKEIWLVYYKKLSGKPRIPYNDAVEEALCYGWIDSTVKYVDEENFAQRFTPRRANSQISALNKERVRKLVKEKRMTSIGLNAIKKVFDLSKKEKLVIPGDILKELKADKKAWENFQKFSESYKRIRIAFIGRRRDYTDGQFQKRLRYFIKMTSKNKRFGMIK
jgi:uncharacterized protein YdeI (YjbR/CyaY-like superfamily)